ncbi:hypothetical protein RJ640_027393 [Escallonia rubra]|uniref:rRNA methyltransferase 1, mitochondrial n=1 Tax=Escallonia rubra TaxID=112253 RepID=A0AA88RPI3_9ASTE|nr:hypothetical protein RJ640_027393 [Escallonia rubra]
MKFRAIHFLKPTNSSIGVYAKTLGIEGNVAESRNFSTRFCLKSALQRYPLVKARGLSINSSQEVVEGSAGKTLPWLAKEAKKSQKSSSTKTGRSSWEESAEKFLKNGVSNVETRQRRRFGNRRNEYAEKSDGLEEEELEGEGEKIDDPRWDKIKHKFDRIADGKPRVDRPEVRKWSKQENWGKKTWKEATESTIPKMVGEGIYGVGPVLAALSAARREFYALYVQEGLDLSGNNKKKKDKKGFERVLRIADKVGLSKKEVSKHDLNMIADNRPHQGLVLDASPLEMVSIRALDTVEVDGEPGPPLWVALDEVTDPQNLGAIIRSAYFFGVAGVVLCAKNSAPLSGVVSKASAGSLELMELRSCKNMMQFLVSSAENGWRVLGGSVSSRAVPLNEVASGVPTILVLGSEGAGLRPLVERSCTQLIRIPGNFPVNVTAGFDDVETVEVDPRCSGEEFQSFLAVESLNVSVAAGVLLHHLAGSNGDNSSLMTYDHTGATD